MPNNKSHDQEGREKGSKSFRGLGETACDKALAVPVLGRRKLSRTKAVGSARSQGRRLVVPGLELGSQGSKGHVTSGMWCCEVGKANRMTCQVAIKHRYNGKLSGH